MTKPYRRTSIWHHASSMVRPASQGTSWQGL
uniref:Uncharacterized protein n=1 Tax=Setaria italica TaxID=4555 RepID=K3ZGN4_SETIT